MTWVPALLNDLDLVGRSALILSVENEARSPPNSEATAGIPIRSAGGGYSRHNKEAVAMFNFRRGGLIVAAMLAVCASTVSAQSETPKNLLQSTRQVPDTFGTQDYSVTTVSAVGFYPEQSGYSYQTSGSKGRFGAINTLTEFYATVDIPSGAVIDFIGLNSITDTAFAYGVNLLSRDAAGNVTSVGTFSSSVHGWGTDYNTTPIGYTWTGQNGNALFINVEQASNPNLEFFGWVEVWWKRSVSPAPATATFTDVPTSNPFFQFVEALAASGVTAGCGGGNFCPDAPLTRGQMAVFLSKALGLHWPGN